MGIQMLSVRSSWTYMNGREVGSLRGDNKALKEET